jgi:hypothetical protein
MRSEPGEIKKRLCPDRDDLELEQTRPLISQEGDFPTSRVPKTSRIPQECLHHPEHKAHGRATAHRYVLKDDVRGRLHE